MCKETLRHIKGTITAGRALVRNLSDCTLPTSSNCDVLEALRTRRPGSVLRSIQCDDVVARSIGYPACTQPIDEIRSCAAEALLQVGCLAVNPLAELMVLFMRDTDCKGGGDQGEREGDGGKTEEHICTAGAG